MKGQARNVSHIHTLWYENFSCVILYPSDSTLCISIFGQFLKLYLGDEKKTIIKEKGTARPGEKMPKQWWKRTDAREEGIQEWGARKIVEVNKIRRQIDQAMNGCKYYDYKYKNLAIN